MSPNVLIPHLTITFRIRQLRRLHEVGSPVGAITKVLILFILSVSEELLCAFELLKPLDGPALRKEMTKAKRKRWALMFHLGVLAKADTPLSMMATTT